MNDRNDAKMIYAQSSDIKSRSYLEYRKDMKKKAIAELEIIEWLSDLLERKYNSKVKVEKSGGDAHIWFLRKGGVTGEADYKVSIDNNEEENYEFQYSARIDLSYFDFKVSKVGKKKGGKRIPYDNKKFIYIVKPTNQYAIFPPTWIIENGIEAGVPAWGNRTAYRVPQDKFLSILINDNQLSDITNNIDIKNKFLDFLFEFLSIEEKELSELLQSVVDYEKIINFVPKEFNSFYKICFILDKINKTPTNISLWIIYLLTYYKDDMDSYNMAKFIYCLDFLYSRSSLKDNELNKIIDIIKKIKTYVKKHQKENGKFETSNELSPKEEIRHMLFIVNILEDLIQDSIYYYRSNLKSIDKIFENVIHIDKIYNMII